MSGGVRRRGRPPTDHERVFAQVVALRAANPQISIRALAHECRVGRLAIRLAIARLEGNAGRADKPDSDARTREATG